MNHIHVFYIHDDREAAQPIVRFLAKRLGKTRVSSGSTSFASILQDDDWLLVVISPDWSQRIGSQASLIQALAEALRRPVQVVPVMINGAILPEADRIPQALQALLWRKPLVLPPEQWEAEVAPLLAAILDPPVAAAVPAPAPLPESATEPAGGGTRIVERIRSIRPSSRTPPSQASKSASQDVDIEHMRKGTRDASRSVFPMPGEPPSPASETADAHFENSSLDETLVSSAPSDEPEPVLLGASAPAMAKPGSEFTASFTAYVKAEEAAVRRILEKRSPRSEMHLGEATCLWQPGTQVTVRLRCRHLDVDPPEQTFLWNGRRHILSFDVYVPPDAPEETVVIKFDVVIADAVVARLRMDLGISRAATARVQHAPAVQPARTAFASYSSLDRSRVLDRIDALTTSAGIRFFMDCIDLHQGEAWKPALAEEIRLQELFMLFWSQHSAASPWVDWELDLAKEHKPREFIQIQALQPDLAPPEGFEARHGSSVYMWVREGNEAVHRRSDGN